MPVARHNANSFRKGNEFGQRLNLHFFHHPVAMSLDRALGPAQLAGDMLVGVADNDKVEDLPLARCQRCEPSVDNIQFGLFAPEMLGGVRAPVQWPEAGPRMILAW